VKLDAVRHALADLPEAVQCTCLETFSRNFGKPRLEHFQAFYRIVGDAAVTLEEFVMQRCALYVDYLRSKYHLSAPVQGARDLVQELAQHDVMCFVITGGIESEARMALNCAGFSGVFSGVVGAPTPKAIAMKRLLSQYRISCNEAIFFGDAIADRDAALKSRIQFVFVRDHSLVTSSDILQGWQRDNLDLYLVNNLEGCQVVDSGKVVACQGLK
jgi:phosphoglycolate phosphatase-like HAD superfamily hydrolase